VLLAFDPVECNGKDLRDLSLIDRKRKLLRLLGKKMTGIQFVDHFPDDGDSVSGTRVKTWLKSKNPNSETVQRERSEDWTR